MSKGITTIKKSMLDFFEIKEYDIYVSNKKGAKDLSDFDLWEMLSDLQIRNISGLTELILGIVTKDKKRKTVFGSQRTELPSMNVKQMMVIMIFSESGLISDIILPVVTDRKKLFIN